MGALEAAALGIFVFLCTKNFFEFVKKGFILALGFIVPFAVFIAYFAPRNLAGEYVFAAYTYYQIYLGESPQYQFIINAFKFLPIAAAVAFGVWQKHKGKVTLLNLFFLWAAFSFLGSFFSGRTYGHYLVQVVPSFALLVAAIPLSFSFKKGYLVFVLIFVLPIIFLTKVLFTDFGSVSLGGQIDYYRNFFEYSRGEKTNTAYNDFFDRNVNSILALNDFIRARNADGETVYIWGDYPWLYALADVNNPSRYVTSFHVFGVPGGREEVIESLEVNPPIYIIKPPSSIGYFAELEKLLAEKYTLDSRIENSDVYRRNE